MEIIYLSTKVFKKFSIEPGIIGNENIINFFKVIYINFFVKIFVNFKKIIKAPKQ